MRTSTMLAIGVCAATLMLACGCVSQESPYRDPCAVRGGGTEFTAYDFQQCAVSMVDSLLASSTLEEKIRRQFHGGRTPIIAIMTVQNRTCKMFDMRDMTQAIETKLANSDKFEFVDRSAELTLLIDEKVHYTDSPLTGDAGVADFGNQARADYILTSELNEIRDSYGRTHESFYRLTMKLLNKKTGIVDWVGEKEIRKVGTRPAVGW